MEHSMFALHKYVFSEHRYKQKGIRVHVRYLSPHEFPSLEEDEADLTDYLLQTKDNNYWINSDLFGCRWLCGCPPTQETRHFGKQL